MFLTLKWNVPPEVVKQRLGVLPAEINLELYRQMIVTMGELREYIVSTKLEGQVLHHRTGNLINATQPSTTQTTSEIVGKVAVDSTAPYGRYQELGASIPERRPIRAKALHWVTAGGSDVFAKYARAFTLPARPFMKPSLAEQREKIISDLLGALKRATL
jgi:hypothetical protein